MKTFDFPYHRVGDDYPESSAKMSYGGGYEFVSKPRSPDQLLFKLTFPGMWFFATKAGLLDDTKSPKINMRVLEKFYEEHRLYEPFLYPHPRRGVVTVRFRQPLKTPDGIAEGNGQVQEFAVELILLP